ncbi:hypothetical protein DID88_006548 [Monilinia fructigena]|uniref:Epoxide hydrolase N-terminal domain-containing protein n=1 Tax=Monilinia fructigena TaxID=38457 RepID=A0A395II45_9HELO|nr:hypothetical protein DID88_006548 [Monilinia fructigena]
MEVLLSFPSSGTGRPGVSYIAPSLPNYGFSEGSRNADFALAPVEIGACNYSGHRKAVSATLQSKPHQHDPRQTAPLHAKPDPRLQHASMPYSRAEHDGFARTKWFAEESRGYFLEQATKPQTLSYGLHDSPVALLAWIYEKLHDWSDAYPWSDDEIFTWVSVYYFSRAGPAATVRIYYEVMHTVAGPQTVTRDDAESYIGG